MRLRRQDGRISMSAVEEPGFVPPPAVASPPSASPPAATLPPVAGPASAAPAAALPYRSIGEILVAMEALPAAAVRGASTPGVPGGAVFRPPTDEGHPVHVAPPAPAVDPLVIVVHDRADPFARVVADLHRVVEQARWRVGRAALRVAVLGVDADGPAALVAANLAAQAALAGTRTLLVDGNVATPVHDRLFGVSREPGLVDVLDGRTAPAAAVHPARLANLSILPTGAIAGRQPSLGDGRLGGALASLQDAFQLVVVDGSRGDAAAVAACEGLDAAVLVVARGGGSAARAADLGRWLQARQVMLAGSVTID